MASSKASSQDAWYLSLLGLAENFRRSEPPNIKLTIQCLQAVFSFKPPVRVEARTHLQLGNILLIYTKNIDLARHHLEQAWFSSQSINAFDDVKFEAASILADLYEQQNQSHLSKPILRKAIELSQHCIYWHCRLIFQLAQIHATEKNYEVACSLLGVGVDYAHISSAHYTRILFLLSRCMLLLAEKKLNDVNPLLVQSGMLIDNWQGNQNQKEYLRVFFLVLQVCWFLAAGQVKSVKPCLKQLQQSILSIMSPSWPTDEEICGANTGDTFLWMPKGHLYVVVYLIIVMHSMQAGYMDKALEYTNKARSQIEKLKFADDKPILVVFQQHLLEHMVMCQLVMGKKAEALREVTQAVQLCQKNKRLMLLHRPQLHTLLGLYAMSMNCMEAAEAQFSTVLQLSKDRDLWTFVYLNLAIVYLRGRREQDFATLFERIDPEQLKKQPHSLQAGAYYVQGFQSFFNARYNEAKRYLREMLNMADAEGLNRLTSCSLVLLGHIYLSLHNSRDSMNMVTPAMHLASKIPDVHVQLWASAILKDLYRMCHDSARESEAQTMHTKFSQTLLEDHFTAVGMPEHNLINWLDGSQPAAAV
ncbi:unnamed protein product [Bemisia tabaci]|uniref:MAU2 chromatid cohesion factor homolog n=1 Tax=Bemisia tabaci TaxID=7038 RepID=A0A9P0F6A8_BEMTA|nr:PREDICTED: MAU2 chromatid cohesion factor homolog [Bemisia tabaci]CAH0391542.1 unnamed protein product [Bemisia tabaci]